MKLLPVFSFLLFLGLLFPSCSKDTRAEDDALLQKYIKDHNLTAIAAQDGLYYTMDVVGTGAQPAGVYSKVTINYSGYFVDGTVFDSSNGFTSTLTSLIKGWQYGIPYFKVGGKGKLLIPSHLAYGTSGAGTIPGNTPIIFDIELLAVQN